MFSLNIATLFQPLIIISAKTSWQHTASAQRVNQRYVKLITSLQKNMYLSNTYKYPKLIRIGNSIYRTTQTMFLSKPLKSYKASKLRLYMLVNWKIGFSRISSGLIEWENFLRRNFCFGKVAHKTTRYMVSK